MLLHGLQRKEILGGLIGLKFAIKEEYMFKLGFDFLILSCPILFKRSILTLT